MPPKRFFLVPGAAFLVIVLGTIGLSLVEYSWVGWRPATCLPDRCFCEYARSGTVAQVANTWSCLVFVLFGLLIISLAQQDSAITSPIRTTNLMTSQGAYGAVYGVALITIGLGSMMYHASLSFVGQFFDVMGMYLLATFIVLYNLSRLIRIRPLLFVVAYGIANALLVPVLLAVPELRRYIFAFLIIAALALEYVIRKKRTPTITRSFFHGSVLSLVVGFVIWILDTTKLVCAPTSLLQGHAIWHGLTAVSAGLLYLYYRSERPGANRSGA